MWDLKNSPIVKLSSGDQRQDSNLEHTKELFQKSKLILDLILRNLTRPLDVRIIAMLYIYSIYDSS